MESTRSIHDNDSRVLLHLFQTIPDALIRMTFGQGVKHRILVARWILRRRQRLESLSAGEEKVAFGLLPRTSSAGETVSASFGA